MTMKPMTAKTHRVLAIALLALVLLLIYGAVDRGLIARYRLYQTTGQELQERLQRLQGMVANRELLETQLQGLKEDKVMAAYYLETSSPTLAATELQQQIKSIVEGNGGNLTSTQILPVTQDNGFTRVAIRVQMQGGTEVLQKVLHRLETARPLLFVDNLTIRSQSIRQRIRGSREVSTTLRVTTVFELAGYMWEETG
jgi:general secretion pathway protein M